MQTLVSPFKVAPLHLLTTNVVNYRVSSKHAYCPNYAVMHNGVQVGIVIPTGDLNTGTWVACTNTKFITKRYYGCLMLFPTLKQAVAGVLVNPENVQLVDSNAYSLATGMLSAFPLQGL